jgi:hypothetical protein
LRFEEAQANLRAAVRTLNMVSYITVFDYFTAGVQGNKVILNGFAISLGIRSETEGGVETLEWVQWVEEFLIGGQS